jgi:hypothetical protein
MPVLNSPYRNSKMRNLEGLNATQKELGKVEKPPSNEEGGQR